MASDKFYAGALVVVLAVLTVFSLFSVTGAGVAWWMFVQHYNNYYWSASGNVEVIGSTTDVLIGCTNMTLASGIIKIHNHRTVTYHYNCPAPRNACERDFCGSDGVCSFIFVSGAQCASNQDCTDFYNSTAYTCGSDCMCTNSSQVLFGFIPFVPENVTVSSGVYFPFVSYYFYRAAGDFLEIKFQLLMLNMTTLPGIQSFIIDISNLPYSLISTGTEYGVGFGTPMIYSLFGANEVFGFTGANGYASSSTTIHFDIAWDDSSNVTSHDIYFNGEFDGRFT